jgi:ribulose-phosphate 3-epimerase
MRAERRVKIAPSILTADFARLGEQVAEATRAGADRIHLDVMDGVFVPSLSFGPLVAKAVRSSTDLPLYVHLMVVQPEKLIDAFAKAGADSLIVHVEACPRLQRTIQQVKAAGTKVGVTLNPATPLSAVEEALPYADELLVMLVNPGFAGQALIPDAIEKVRRARRMLDESGLHMELAVDGGVNAETAPKLVEAGATVLVAGSAVFNEREPVADAIRRLRTSVEGAQRISARRPGKGYEDSGYRPSSYGSDRR